MHLEETLQLSIDEKEEIIKALQTQVDKLLTQWQLNFQIHHSNTVTFLAYKSKLPQASVSN